MLILEYTTAVAAEGEVVPQYDYQYWTLSFITFVNISFLPLNRLPCFPSVFRLWVHIMKYICLYKITMDEKSYII